MQAAVPRLTAQFGRLLCLRHRGSADLSAWAMEQDGPGEATPIFSCSTPTSTSVFSSSREVQSSPLQHGYQQSRFANKVDIDRVRKHLLFPVEESSSAFPSSYWYLILDGLASGSGGDKTSTSASTLNVPSEPTFKRAAAAEPQASPSSAPVPLQSSGPPVVCAPRALSFIRTRIVEEPLSDDDCAATESDSDIETIFSPREKLIVPKSITPLYAAKGRLFPDNSKGHTYFESCLQMGIDVQMLIGELEVTEICHYYMRTNMVSG
jgi:hypothetical protein